MKSLINNITNCILHFQIDSNSHCFDTNVLFILTLYICKRSTHQRQLNQLCMYICSDIIHIIQIYHHIIHIMHIYKRRIDRRHFIMKGCNAFEDEYSRHAQIKCDLLKGTHSGLPGNMQSWKCDVYESMLLPRAGYENHLKGNHKKYKQANCHLYQPVASSRQNSYLQIIIRIEETRSGTEERLLATYLH